MPELQAPPTSAFDSFPEIPHPKAFPDALALLKDLYFSDKITWRSNGTKDGIELRYSDEDPSLPVPISRGDGVFPAEYTAEQILPVLYNLAYRKHWDERFKSGFQTARYNHNLVGFYSVQKGVGEGWFTVVSPRDFTGYSGHVKEVGEDGKTRMFYLQTSAEFENVPAVEGNVRGETSVAGWVLEEGNPGEGVKVTYIVKFDPKGSIPAALTARVVKETPLCIATSRDFLQSSGYPPHVHRHDPFPGRIRQEYVTEDEPEINPETGESLSDGGFRFTFSWFGEPGSFNIYFNDKTWKKGAKIHIVDGKAGEDFEIETGKGLFTITVKEAGKRKPLKVEVSEAE